jgi:hypothetical protein
MIKVDQISFKDFEKDSGALQLVFEDGAILTTATFNDIRDRIKQYE